MSSSRAAPLATASLTPAQPEALKLRSSTPASSVTKQTLSGVNSPMASVVVVAMASVVVVPAGGSVAGGAPSVVVVASSAAGLHAARTRAREANIAKTRTERFTLDSSISVNRGRADLPTSDDSDLLSLR